MININWKNAWILGEYKYMPFGSKMPEGWKKIKSDEWTFLGFGDYDALPIGKITHIHSTNTPTPPYISYESNQDLPSSLLVTYTDEKSNELIIKYKKVDLWQYDPNNDFTKE